jgi:hypothetical protein
MLVDITADKNAESREAANRRILSGSLAEIPYSMPTNSLTHEEACAIVGGCIRQLNAYRGEFNGVGFGGTDAYRILTQVAIAGPEMARPGAWDAVVEGIVANDVIHDRKTSAVDLLAAHSDSIPEEHRDALYQAAERLRSVPPSAFSGVDSLSLTHAGPAFQGLYLELHPEEDDDWRGVLNGLLAGTPQQRSVGVEVLARRPGHELLLLAMTRDTDLDLAHSAMRGLARRAAEDTAVAQAALPTLLSLVNSAGEQAALNIGRGIAMARKRVPAIAPLVLALQSHESLQIRSIANELSDLRLSEQDGNT